MVSCTEIGHETFHWLIFACAQDPLNTVLYRALFVITNLDTVSQHTCAIGTFPPEKVGRQ